MKQVNPFERMNIGKDGTSPRACACSSGFVTAKTPSDNCFYCGYQCSNTTVAVGNKDKARFTVRKS
ncbi:MAG: hypothetical protein ACRCXT_09740 [Paraclostridium sp.]